MPVTWKGAPATRRSCTAACTSCKPCVPSAKPTGLVGGINEGEGRPAILRDEGAVAGGWVGDDMRARHRRADRGERAGQLIA